MSPNPHPVLIHQQGNFRYQGLRQVLEHLVVQKVLLAFQKFRIVGSYFSLYLGTEEPIFAELFREFIFLLILKRLGTRYLYYLEKIRENIRIQDDADEHKKEAGDHLPESRDVDVIEGVPGHGVDGPGEGYYVPVNWTK